MRRGASKSRYSLAFLCLFLAVANIVLWFPGIMTHDSFRQYSEAVSGAFTAWHPPVMAWLWSYLLPFSGGGSGLLVIHILLYWLSFYLIAATLLEMGRRHAAIATLCVALAPPFIVLMAFIWKDVGMMVTIFAAFAIIFRQRMLSRIGAGSIAAIILLLAYAILVRSNAIFGVAPVILYVWRPALIHRPLWLLPVCAVLTFIAIPVSGAINRFGFHAEGAAFKSLILYDLVGTAHFSRDVSYFPVPVSLDLIDHCYSPKWWDPIASGVCRDPLSFSMKNPRPLLYSVLMHPISYAEHRIAHFNEAMFAFVGSEGYRYEDTDFTRRYRSMPQAPLMLEGTRLHMQLQSFPLFSPALFLLIALQILGLTLAQRRRTGLLGESAFYLALSSALYSLSFLLVGVANMSRYQFYPVAAAAIALILFLTERSARGDRLSRAEWSCVVVTAMFAIAIGLSRLVL